MDVLETIGYGEAAQFLGIPERVLREWVQWNFRSIPYHKLGSGKQAEIGFFKDEIDTWFRRNGGTFLKDKVQDKPRNMNERPRPSYVGNRKPYQKREDR